MDYSVIIANYNGKHLLDRCLSALVPQVEELSGIILVDNGSADGSVDHVKQRWPGITVAALDGNTGFTGANNAGAALSDSEKIVLLNNDTRVAPDWLQKLLIPLEDPSIGAVTSSMRRMGEPSVIDSAGGRLDYLGYAHDRGRGDSWSDWQDTAEILFPCGGAMAVRRSALEDRHSIFWDALFLYNEDTDLGLRLWENGYKVVYQPDAVVEHVFSATAGTDSPVKTKFCSRNRILVLKRHLGHNFARIASMLAMWESLALGYMLSKGQLHRFRMSLAGSREGFSTKVKPVGNSQIAEEILSRFMQPTVGTFLRRKIGDSVYAEIKRFSS